MSRLMAVLAVVSLAAVVALGGCAKKAEPQPQVQIPEPVHPTDDAAKLAPIEPLPTNAGTGSTSDPITVGGPGATSTAGQRVHVAEPKDNYYRLAIKYYGSGNKANVDKIQAANPTIPANKIPVGAKIVIP